MQRRQLQTDKSLLDSALSLIDFFMPAETCRKNKDLYRSRILIGTCLTISVALTFLVIFAWLFSSLHPNAKLVITISVLPIIALFTGLLFVYKKYNTHHLCANAISFTAVLTISYTIFTNGGPAVSSASYLMGIPALLGFTLMAMCIILIYEFMNL